MDVATRNKQFSFWKKAVARSKGWLKDDGEEPAPPKRVLPLLAAVGIGAVIGMALSRITSRL